MGIPARESSPQCLERVPDKKSSMFDASDSEIPKTTPASGNTNEAIRSKIKRMGPICKSRTKTAAVVSPVLPVEDEIDLDKQLDNTRDFDDNESMWLSSDASSPSSFFREYRLSAPLHQSTNEWLGYWLSTLADSFLYLDKARNLSDETRMNARKKETLALRERNILAENIRHEERSLHLLPEMVKDGVLNSPVTCSESATSSSVSCSISSENSLTPASTISGSGSSCSSSQISDLERMSFLAPLVNLDREESRWISDVEFELKSLESSFLSPTCRSSWSSDRSSTSTSAISKSNGVGDEHSQLDIFSKRDSSEAEDLQDLSVDEQPLFWPFERKLNWSSEETWKCFAMSPRKGTSVQGTPICTTSNPVASNSDGAKQDSKRGCRRKLVFGSSSAASKVLAWKQRSINNSNRKIHSAPSRLRKATNITMETVPVKVGNDVKEAADDKIPISELDSMDRSLLEDDITSKPELPIETLMGLGEFDGHEGVDSEFNEDIFSLDDSL
ncbi:hypothetical protein Tsubulata_021391 [Turnera subulata]|uniref:Uncharacterized protein n=1 Tax=Turnera subulata TaxID=218843 RepID=A0A9Q0JH17_9ROSI|nr:hypothetical protein Tsubulata_021391 [Turnera subulata]